MYSDGAKRMKQKVDFANAFKKQKEAPPAANPNVSSARPPSRQGTKHVGAHFDPAVTRQLREIAAEEDTSIQRLLGEALNMLFVARGKPPIAKEEPYVRSKAAAPIARE
jgi:hypothetical protein